MQGPCHSAEVLETAHLLVTKIIDSIFVSDQIFDNFFGH